MRIISAVKKVEFVSDSMSIHNTKRGRWCHIIVLNNENDHSYLCSPPEDGCISETCSVVYV
jgi:hypothetical protein